MKFLPSPLVEGVGCALCFLSWNLEPCVLVKGERGEERDSEISVCSGPGWEHRTQKFDRDCKSSRVFPTFRSLSHQNFGFFGIILPWNMSPILTGGCGVRTGKQH